MINLLLAFFFLAADPLPTGEAVLAKYLEATGGMAAHEKIHGSLSKGTMSLTAQNLKGTVTVYESDPGKQVVIIDFTGIGKIEEGTDGKIAWSSSALQGARLKEGDEKDAALRAANASNKFLDWKKFYKSVQNVGLEDVDGKSCYKLMMVPLTGKPEVDYYDKATGLLVKETATVVTPMGEVQTTARPGDYRKEGDVLLPHKLVQSVAGQTIEMNITSVEFNPDFPKDRFEPPADVKALIK